MVAVRFVPIVPMYTPARTASKNRPSAAARRSTRGIIPREDGRLGAGGLRVFRLRRAKREGHGSFEHNLAADPYHAFEHAHAAPDPHDVRLDFEDIAGMNGMPEPNALDAREEGETLAIFRFCQNQNGADLRHGFRENRR